MASVRVGLFPSVGQLTGGPGLHAMLARAAGEGVDHLCVGDHVSFVVGAGSDGLIAATSMLARQGELPVYVGLYLLPLRHPVPVARQLATIALLAPGRLTLGVGIGGEDPHEIEICGVDPRTRGRRMDECLRILRVAEFLFPYIEAGCSAFNVIPCAGHVDSAIAAVGELRTLLTGSRNR
jgi:alkanesulfonate monooxygenase SsuD/methylene tetrahydromethanopterin reductase-like flavin-dependent oxidoreductase (luciferase family)